MKKIGNYIYSNFQYFPIQKTQQKETASGILLGYSGCGKTSLFNNLCGTNEPVGFAQQLSLTTLLTSADCCSLAKDSLHMYDSPGIVEGRSNGVLQIFRVLRYLSWNLIIIMCRFQAHYKLSTFSPIKKFLKIFKDYSSQILIMFSNVDEVDDGNQSDLSQSQLLKNLPESLKQSEILQNVILFSNKKSDFKKLSQIIHYYAVQNKPKNITLIDNKVISKSFGYDKLNDKAKQQIQEYIRKLDLSIQHQNNFKLDQVKKNIKQKVNLIVKKETEQDREGLILICEKYLAEKIRNKNINQTQSQNILTTQTSTGTLPKVQKAKSKERKSGSMKANIHKKKKSVGKLTKFIRTNKQKNITTVPQRKLTRTSKQINLKAVLSSTNIQRKPKTVNDPQKKMGTTQWKFNPINISSNPMTKFESKLTLLTEQQIKRIIQSKWVAKQEKNMNYSSNGQR